MISGSSFPSRLCSRAAWLGVGLWLCALLSMTGSAAAEKSGATQDEGGRSFLEQIASSGGQVGRTALTSIVTADYRAYRLEDLFPLEQIYLPTVALPPERHPALLCPEDREELRRRILREPYAGWWNEIQRVAGSSLSMDMADRGLTESQRALAAKSCAFVYLITGQSPYLDKAREALLNISPPPSVTTPEGGRLGEGWGDWMRASALMLVYCVAYDLVAPELSARDQRTVTEKIAAEADQLYRHLNFAPPNNHKIIMAVAAGTAALTIPSSGCGQPQAWLDAAVTHLRSGLAQIDRDGSYREGVFYTGYMSHLLFPFLLYLKNTTGLDLFVHRRTEDLVQWLIRIGTPAGTMPLFDDAWQLDNPFLPILVGQSRLGGVARWVWERQPLVRSGQLNEVEFLCAFDDRVPAEPPPWERTTFFPDGGMAVFGDGWSSQGIYLLLLGEGESALASGHEHLDPGNFLLQAYGHDLIIDPGYGPSGSEDPGRSWYLSAEGHNMILVDGQGPRHHPFSADRRGGDLGHCFRGPGLSGAAVTTHYGGTQIQRTVYFLGQRYFLIFDQLRSPEPHQYEFILHGLGQICQERADRFAWIQGQTSLETEWLAPEIDPLTVSLRTGQQSFQVRRPENHTYLRASLSPRSEARFITLLVPHQEGQPDLSCVEVPTVSSGRAQARQISGESLGAERHLLLATDGQEASAEGVESDAVISATSLGADGQRAFFLVGGGTFYAHLGDTCFSSDRAITISLITELDRWCGYVDAGDDTVAIQLETGSDPGQVRFREFPVAYDYQAGKVHLHLAGSGPLELGVGPPLIDIPKSSPDQYPFLEQVARQQEPMGRWEQMGPEERFLAEQQAVDVAREEINGPLRDLSRRMGLGPDGLSQGLGVITGLADQAYDSQNWVRLNIPQALAGRRDATWGQLGYAQQGRLTEAGWRMERLEGTLSAQDWGTVTVGHYSPYPEAHYQTVGLKVGKVSLSTGREDTDGQRRRNFSAFHQPGQSIWGLQGQAGQGWEEYGLDLIWRSPTMTAEISQYRDLHRVIGRRLELSRQGRAFSPRLELQDPGGSSRRSLSAGWASRPWKGLHWDGHGLAMESSAGLKVVELSQHIWGQRKSVSGQWHGLYRDRLGLGGWGWLQAQMQRYRWILGTNFHQRGKPFFSQESISLLCDWARWISSTIRLIFIARDRDQRDDISAALSAHLKPSSRWQVHVHMEGRRRETDRIAWGLGLDRWGKASWGAGWSRSWSPERRKCQRISLHATLKNAQGAGLRGRAELEVQDGDQVAAYQIEVQRLNDPLSPGLLFSKSPLTGVRNDGFIRFRF